MSLLKYFKPKPDSVHDRNDVDSGMLIFGSTSEVIRAALTNRLSGYLARPTPATAIGEIISHIPAPLQETLAVRKLLSKESNAIP